MEEAAAETANGNLSAQAAVDAEEEPMVGPGPAPRSRLKRPLQFEQAYLNSLPSANMYVLRNSLFYQDQTQRSIFFWV